MDTVTLLILVLLVILGYLYTRSKRTVPPNLPPGPPSIPILGSIPFVGKDLRKEALRLSKEYDSALISIKLGPHQCVFFNTFDTIKAAFSSDDFTDRPNTIFFIITDKHGIACSDGALWKEHRRLSLSVLRDMGMGKMAAEEKVREEARQLCKEIDQLRVKPFDISYIFNIATANVLSATMFGQRYDYDDPEFTHCVTRFKENLTLFSNNNLLAFYPSLRHLPGNFFHYRTIVRNVESVYKFLEKHIREHKERFNPGNIADFLDAYLAEKERQDEKNPNNTFTDYQIKALLTDIFMAGSETSATTLHWGILLMMAYPEVQQKVQNEIDGVLGKDRIPTMHERRRLPYTEATVLETHRWATLAGLGLPHCNLHRDVTFRNYTIPKETMMMPNIWAVHRDRRIWKYPDVFDPRNFLDDEGQVVYKNELIPFVIGRRQCPGEALAKMEVFLFFTTLLQRFTFTFPDGAKTPDLDGVFSPVTNAPPEFEVCVTPRGDSPME